MTICDIFPADTVTHIFCLAIISLALQQVIAPKLQAQNRPGPGPQRGILIKQSIHPKNNLSIRPKEAQKNWALRFNNQELLLDIDFQDMKKLDARKMCNQHAKYLSTRQQQTSNNKKRRKIQIRAAGKLPEFVINLNLPYSRYSVAKA